MLIVGALALAYAFCYATGAISALGYALDNKFTVDGVQYKYDMDIAIKGESSILLIADGKWDATYYTEIQSFNSLLMYFGIAIIVLAVVLYITACNSRRKYYVTNYVATGICAGGNIVMSFVAIIMNIIWRAQFLNVDFEAWKAFNSTLEGPKYSESTLWFDLGFVVYAIVIIASLLLIFNLVWKVLLMKGEKKLLEASPAPVEEGAAV